MTSDEGRKRKRNRRAQRARLVRWGFTGFTLSAGLMLLVLLFADELARATTRGTMQAPIALPSGVEIRVAPRLVRIIGAPSGGASAVTLGRTILVPHTRVIQTSRPTRSFGMSGDTVIVTSSLWSEVIRHELVHVRQRDRYGRWYLPLYIVWYLRHGYRGHPFEVEAGV